MRKISSFTLIELLIVIVIIGILAVALIPRLTGSQARARNTVRKADFTQIQTALEFYASEHNGSYPSTQGGYYGACWYGNKGLTGSGGWIPNLAPEYMSVLPLDPKPNIINTNQDGCYLYRSDGIDYMIMAHFTYEGKVPDEFKRPLSPSNNYGSPIVDRHLLFEYTSLGLSKTLIEKDHIFPGVKLEN